MTTADTLARLRAIIEEELGEFRAFAGLPATEIETMAERLTRVVAAHWPEGAELRRTAA